MNQENQLDSLNLTIQSQKTCPVDISGELRQRDQAEENIEVALELMTSIDHKSINKQAFAIIKTLPELLV